MDAMNVLSALLATILGMSLLAALRMIAGRQSIYRDDLLYTVLHVAGWTMILGGALVGFIRVMSVLAVLVWLMIMMVAIEILAKRRLNRQYAMLSLLAVSTERMIPLSSVIEAFAREEQGLFSQRAVRLSEQLAAGVPFPEAIRRNAKVLPREILPLLEIGFRGDALPAALRQGAASHQQYVATLEALAARVGFLSTVPMLSLCLILFIGTRIAPSYGKIFKDFDTELPPITEQVFRICGMVEHASEFVVLAMLGGGLLLGYVNARRCGIIRWDLPLVGWLTRRLDGARVLEALALAVQRNLPLTEVIETLAQSYPKRAIRRRLFRVLADVRSGLPWDESLHTCGLIGAADLAILRSARRVGNLSWAMREMAESSRRRLALRYHSLLQVLTPALVVAFGAVIMVVAVACFMPLVALIRRLA